MFMNYELPLSVHLTHFSHAPKYVGYHYRLSYVLLYCICLKSKFDLNCEIHFLHVLKPQSVFSILITLGFHPPLKNMTRTGYANVTEDQ